MPDLPGLTLFTLDFTVVGGFASGIGAGGEVSGGVVVGQGDGAGGYGAGAGTKPDLEGEAGCGACCQGDLAVGWKVDATVQ